MKTAIPGALRLRSVPPRRAGLVLLSGLVVVVVVVVITIVLRAGGDDGPGIEKLSGSDALVSGLVTDARTKAPLVGAVIAIDQEGGTLTVRTDSRGAYRTVVNASRPIGMTITAPAHQGSAAFGKLCPGERRDLPVQLPPADPTQAPPAPIVMAERCP